jgi:xanthine dehydrogenase accessory factor
VETKMLARGSMKNLLSGERKNECDQELNQSEFTKTLAKLTTDGTPFVVATVVKTEGGSLGKPGFKAVISATGDVVCGSLGGVCPESAITAVAKETMQSGVPKTVKVHLENAEDSVAAVVKGRKEDEIHVETNCGGIMTIFVEPYLP